MENSSGDNLLKDLQVQGYFSPTGPRKPRYLMCMFGFQIPDPSVSSEKRAEPVQQQGMSNCVKERSKEKYVICFWDKGKALFF